MAKTEKYFPLKMVRFKYWTEICKYINGCPKKSFRKPGEILLKITLKITKYSGSLKAKYKESRDGSQYCSSASTLYV